MNSPAAPLAHAHFNSLAHACQAPSASARLRCLPEDFCVWETLSFEPSGTGNHAYLYLQKRQLTTEELARTIASLANVTYRDVGYAGLKDKNALTSQWFSVDLSGKPEPDWRRLQCDQISVLHTSRHERKLKKGSIKANRFALTLRGLQGDTAKLEPRLEQIGRRGVPNYFAEQRFGGGENNLNAAYRMFTTGRKVKNRHLRGLYYSAARSYLFNLVLSCRVSAGLWDQGVSGDAMMLEGSRSFFVADVINGELEQRLQSADIHPSGPLWGNGELATRGEARELELRALQDQQAWRQGLEDHGLEHQRRALRLAVKDFSWQFSGRDELHLKFFLTSGAYATSVVRELVSQI